MKGITSASYLTRKDLDRLYRTKLTDVELQDLVFKGEIIKHFSYYKASESLLRKWKIIPSSVEIQSSQFSFIAKKSAFTMQQLMEIFDCNKDTVKLLIKQYFQRRNNYYYKNDIIQNSLLDGEVRFKI